MALIGMRKGLSHFHYLMEHPSIIREMTKAHMEKEPIVLGNMTITYPETFKPKPISIPKPPPPRVPKASAGNEFLEERGIIWTTRVTMSQAKRIYAQLGGGGGARVIGA
jgi:hypothetical protein